MWQQLLSGIMLSSDLVNKVLQERSVKLHEITTYFSRGKNLGQKFVMVRVGMDKFIGHKI